MTELTQAIQAYLRGGRVPLAVADLWDARIEAANTDDRVRLGEVATLAHEVAAVANSKYKRRAQEIARLAEAGLPPASDRAKQAAEETKQATEETIKKRLASIRETRAERDLNPTATFEYAVLEVDTAAAEELLGQAGALGWEAFSAMAATDPGKRTLYLRRLVSVTKTGSAGTVATVGGATAFGAAYFESGPDVDRDGDVDGGLLDRLGEIFE